MKSIRKELEIKEIGRRGGTAQGGRAASPKMTVRSPGKVAELIEYCLCLNSQRDTDPWG